MAGKWAGDEEGYSEKDLKERLKEESEDSIWDHYSDDAREKAQEAYPMDKFLKDIGDDEVSKTLFDKDYDTWMKDWILENENLEGPNPGFDPNQPESEDNPKNIPYDGSYGSSLDVEDHPDWSNYDTNAEEAFEEAKNRADMEPFYENYDEAIREDIDRNIYDLRDEDLENWHSTDRFLPEHVYEKLKNPYKDKENPTEKELEEALDHPLQVTRYGAAENKKLPSSLIDKVLKGDDDDLKSKVLENPNTHIVIDSSRFQGYIADAIVCNREFLLKNSDKVRSVIESYFYALHSHKNDFDDLIVADSIKFGTPLSTEQVKNLEKGIWWKNTQENYAHFGLVPSRLQHVQNIIENLTAVLVKSKAIRNDPTQNRANMLYYDKILVAMLQANFYPGISPDKISDQIDLPKLTDTEWNNLMPIGTLEVPNLVFLRGTYDLTERSRIILDDLVKTLNTFPQYYVIVQGNAVGVGDIAANKILALARAKAAVQYLAEKGIKPDRIKATSENSTNGSASVRFVLGQAPF